MKINLPFYLKLVDISNINEFCIELKRKEEDLKSIVESLCSIIKNTRRRKNN